MKTTQEHKYALTNKWTGNTGNGTATVRGYERSHTVSIQGKPDQYLTTDNKLVGDPSKLNPEDLLVTALSSCHLMSYLYVCALEGIVVTDYVDNATGIMVENDKGGGRFKEVTLNPVVTVQDSTMVARAIELHHKAHEVCYIANSVNFEVRCMPVCSVQ
jgi:organic hydroperoxide reductase OsmC/OhrA